MSGLVKLSKISIQVFTDGQVKMKTLMKRLKLLTFLTVNLLIGLPLNQVVVAQQGVIEIQQELFPDPLVISGNSLARVKKECGLLPSQPNQIIVVQQSIPYLRLTLEGEEKATLLVDGPGGRFLYVTRRKSTRNDWILVPWRVQGICGKSIPRKTRL